MTKMIQKINENKLAKIKGSAQINIAAIIMVKADAISITIKYALIELYSFFIYIISYMIGGKKRILRKKIPMKPNISLIK